jgi:cytoskeletal protein RodZ
MNYLKLTLAGLLLLTLGMGLGYYEAPTKTITETKKDVSQDTNVNNTVTTQKTFDPNTGKQTSETTIVVHDTDTKKDTNTDKTKITEKEQKHYAVKVGGVVNPRDPTTQTARVGGEVRLPFFNSWAGVESDLSISKPLVGAYLRLEF